MFPRSNRNKKPEDEILAKQREIAASRKRTLGTSNPPLNVTHSSEEKQKQRVGTLTLKSWTKNDIIDLTLPSTAPANTVASASTTVIAATDPPLCRSLSSSATATAKSDFSSSLQIVETNQSTQRKKRFLDSISNHESQTYPSSQMELSKKYQANDSLSTENHNDLCTIDSTQNLPMTSPTNSIIATLKRAPIRKKISHGVTDTSNSSITHSFLERETLPRISKKDRPLYPNVEVEDFWRDVRNWDILTDLNHLMTQSHPPTTFPSSRNKEDSPFTMHPTTTTTTSTNHSSTQDCTQRQSTIPTLFQSPQEYKALWAPHCLAESRAQILSDFSLDVVQWTRHGTLTTSTGKSTTNHSTHASHTNYKLSHHKNAKKSNHGKGFQPIQVKVSTLKKDVGTHTDYLTIQIQPLESNKDSDSDVSFLANDIVLLTTHLNHIVLASKGLLSTQDQDSTHPYPNSSNSQESKNHSRSYTNGDESTQSQKCIVGHIEYSRRNLDGLQIKVSRTVWLRISPGSDSVMYLVRVGVNITALREFTALCRIDSIPLLPYLLKAQRSVQQEPMQQQQSTATNNKQDLLETMGGKDALGKGFVHYLDQKYNASQIAAIAAAASEYGDGGFTLVKGPPGTGKTTTLVALLNALHIRQFNKYFDSVRKIAADRSYLTSGAKKLALDHAAKDKPRILVCAPSNAAVDNVILKIMESGFVDGNGSRYNPSMIRVGYGQSNSVKAVSLESMVDDQLSDIKNLAKLDTEVAAYKSELTRIQSDILRLRRRTDAILRAAPWPLAKDWEIRCDDNFEQNNKVFFVNHKEKSTTYECPPPPEPGEKHFPATAMPEYRAFVAKIVKLVERFNSVSSNLERCIIVRKAAVLEGDGKSSTMETIRIELETHFLDSVHIVLTTLGTAGSRALESAAKFEVVVVDEAAQSVEPSSLTALQLGSSHAILVGDPQQLPATIFSVSGRSTKYDRSLFQRLEEAGHPVHMLEIQYRMHPKISEFPRCIFYKGILHDGPNVQHAEYGNPLRRSVCTNFPCFQPFTILDLDSSEERDGTSMSNMMEARLALHLFTSLVAVVGDLLCRSRVAVVTPYAQQSSLLRRLFSEHLRDRFETAVEVNTIDAFQGREAEVVIFSCVRAAGSKGIGFLSDVRRMNVALTRAKYFLFVIARCKTISTNPYWNDLVTHANEIDAVVPIRLQKGAQFPDLKSVGTVKGEKAKIASSETIAGKSSASARMRLNRSKSKT